VHRKTTGLIGGECTCRKAFSLAVLMHEGLIHVRLQDLIVDLPLNC
jgi:hypothetical protein